MFHYCPSFDGLSTMPLCEPFGRAGLTSTPGAGRVVVVVGVLRHVSVTSSAVDGPASFLIEDINLGWRARISFDGAFVISASIIVILSLSQLDTLDTSKLDNSNVCSSIRESSFVIFAPSELKSAKSGISMVGIGFETTARSFSCCRNTVVAATRLSCRWWWWCWWWCWWWWCWSPDVDVHGTGFGAIDTRFLFLPRREVLWSTITKSSVGASCSRRVSLLNLCGHVFLSRVFFRRRKHVDGQMHKSTLITQHRSPTAINVGPMSRSSRVLNPFSPVPTNHITSPMTVVPRPTYSSAFAAALW